MVFMISSTPDMKRRFRKPKYKSTFGDILDGTLGEGLMSKLTGMLFALASVALAQTPTAEITGSVTDSSGAVVAGAAVEITHKDTNSQRVLLTNSAGLYDAP